MSPIVSALVLLALANAASARNLLLDGRIVGGYDVMVEEHPYQVTFEVLGVPLCGAALINPNYAVSSAECVRKFYDWIKVTTIRAGSTIRGDCGQVTGIESFCEHPKFPEQNSLDYDVVVIHLNSSFTLNEKVQLISLQRPGVEVADGSLGTATGWGATRPNGQKSSIMQALQVPKINSQKCASFYPLQTITTRMNCYGYIEGGKGRCDGDAGSPLVVNGRLAGISSWGYGCADADRPGVYTNIGDPEIVDHINRCIEA